MKADPWEWFWPLALLLFLYGCQQDHQGSKTCESRRAAFERGEAAGEKIRDVID